MCKGSWRNILVANKLLIIHVSCISRKCLCVCVSTCVGVCERTYISMSVCQKEIDRADYVV